METPYFTGETTAMCMKEPLFDLITENVTGVHCAHGRASAGFGSASYRRQGCRAASDFGGHSWRTNCNRRQESDFNFHKTSPRRTTIRPKSELIHRTVKEPVRNVDLVEWNISIFGSGKPREASPLREARVRCLMENR